MQPEHFRQFQYPTGILPREQPDASAHADLSMSARRLRLGAWR
jgi:hypothetical protein